MNTAGIGDGILGRDTPAFGDSGTIRIPGCPIGDINGESASPLNGRRQVDLCSVTERGKKNREK